MNLNLEVMSREEKIQTMQAIWEDLAREDGLVQSPAWHGDALNETAERLHAGIERVWDWQEAKMELRRRAG